jgi:hypothetical protein
MSHFSRPSYNLQLAAADETDRKPINGQAKKFPDVTGEESQEGLTSKFLGESPEEPRNFPRKSPEEAEIPGERYKKFKLSFYDCISLYCGGLVGGDRNNCILKFCNRL